MQLKTEPRMAGLRMIEVLRPIRRKRRCPPPKLYPACIFNHFLRPPAARSDGATLRLRRSQTSVRTTAPASLSAPAHPYTKINAFWNGGRQERNALPSHRLRATRNSIRKNIRPVAISNLIDQLD